MQNYNRLKLPELQGLAKKRGIATAPLKYRQHFIDALKAADAKVPSEEPKEAQPNEDPMQLDPSVDPTKIQPDEADALPDPTMRESVTDISRYDAEISTDWGTSKWTSHFVFSQDGTRMGPIKCVRFAHGSAEVPMIAAFIGERFVHGWDLESLANKDPMVADKVMSSFKLFLYPDSTTAPVTQRVTRLLGESGKTQDDLLYEHLKAQWRDTKIEIKLSTYQNQFSDADFEVLFARATVYLTVPEMWGPHARRRMQAAAKKAGMGRVVLLSEPQCALAFFMDKEAQKDVVADRQLRKGDSILSADIGKGTADFVIHELEDDLGVDCKLKSVGKSSGHLCGSGIVDELIWDAYTKRQGRDWIIQSAKDLKVTERDFERRGLSAAEGIKIRFGTDEDGFALMRGIGPAHAVMTIYRAEYEHAMNSVIAPIKQHMDALIRRRLPSVLNVIAVMGGYSKSQYVMNALRDYYGPQNIRVQSLNDSAEGESFPVSMGALLRYNSISRPKLPAQYGYALTITERFDPYQHPDACTLDWDDDQEEEVVTLLKPCVLESFYDCKVNIVEHRIHNIIKIGADMGTGQVFKHDLELEYRIPWNNPHISADFVLTDKTLKDHAAAKNYDPDTETYEFRPGVHPWASLKIPILRSLLENEKFTTERAHGEKFWVIRARVFVQFQGEDLRIGFDIFKEDSEKVAFQAKDTVWEAEHSEFME